MAEKHWTLYEASRLDGTNVIEMKVTHPLGQENDDEAHIKVGSTLEYYWAWAAVKEGDSMALEGFYGQSTESLALTAVSYTHLTLPTNREV